ncbi:aminoglycoside phosphotransferase family protein [Micromonospora sp. CA-269861]|uniref:aminoglycoside phosphotransferase family protein n=1 Tax=Micromonospora sp. CA-269861 TaxID=3239968 RepID=UPI003D8D205E
MHDGQLAVPFDVVRELVDAQFPEWRSLPVRRIASQGTVNAIFRIGDRLTARFPLEPREVDAARDWLEREAEAARELLGRTRFPTPEPVAIGEPGDGYPLPWSVQTWLPGVVATDSDPGESVAFAHDLAEFVRGVRAIDTRGRTFSGQGRGGELPAHDEWVETCLRRSETLLDVPPLRRMWEVMRELPRGGAPDLMNHGDLIPGNVLVSDGRLAGVLDVGGLGPADPALDLVSAWHLLEREPRQAFRQQLGCDDLEWERGRAWAFQQAMGLVWYYQQTNPTMSRMGRRTLARITAGWPPGPPASTGTT